MRNTTDQRLHFSNFPTVLEGFCDANWISNKGEVSFTSGNVFALGERAIS